MMRPGSAPTQVGGATSGSLQTHPANEGKKLHRSSSSPALLGDGGSVSHKSFSGSEVVTWKASSAHAGKGYNHNLGTSQPPPATGGKKHDRHTSPAAALAGEVPIEGGRDQKRARTTSSHSETASTSHAPRSSPPRTEEQGSEHKRQRTAPPALAIEPANINHPAQPNTEMQAPSMAMNRATTLSGWGRHGHQEASAISDTVSISDHHDRDRRHQQLDRKGKAKVVQFPSTTSPDHSSHHSSEITRPVVSNTGQTIGAGNPDSHEGRPLSNKLAHLFIADRDRHSEYDPWQEAMHRVATDPTKTQRLPKLDSDGNPLFEPSGTSPPETPPSSRPPSRHSSLHAAPPPSSASSMTSSQISSPPSSPALSPARSSFKFATVPVPENPISAQYGQGGRTHEPKSHGDVASSSSAEPTTFPATSTSSASGQTHNAVSHASSSSPGRTNSLHRTSTALPSETSTPDPGSRRDSYDPSGPGPSAHVHTLPASSGSSNHDQAPIPSPSRVSSHGRPTTPPGGSSHYAPAPPTPAGSQYYGHPPPTPGGASTHPQPPMTPIQAVGHDFENQKLTPYERKMIWLTGGALTMPVISGLSTMANQWATYNLTQYSTQIAAAQAAKPPSTTPIATS